MCLLDPHNNLCVSCSCGAGNSRNYVLFCCCCCCCCCLQFQLSGANSSDNANEHIKGALDMGGASTQITFIPRNFTGIVPHDLQQLKLYGTEYKVYTYSYLCYGKNEAERRFLAQLVKV